MPNERILPLDADVARGGSARDNEGLCFHPGAIHFDAMRRAGLKFLHNAILESGAKFFRLLVHALDQFRPVHAFGKAWKIFYGRRGGQLSSGHASFENERREIGAGGVNCGCESGTTGADNDDIFHKRTQ